MSPIRSFKVLALVAVLVAACGVPASLPALAGAVQSSTSNIQLVSDASVVPGAYSTLRRLNTGVQMTLHTSMLPAITVDTVWWIIFNQPSNCTQGTPPFRCGLGDLGNPAVDGSVAFADGHVIGGTGVGNYGGYLAVGDTSGVIPGYGSGLHNPLGADIHLIVHGHGVPVPGMVDQQMHSFPGCFAPNVDGVDCRDLQFSVHEAP
jgi:prepilin-type processing-associated H-X9-DG protein